MNMEKSTKLKVLGSIGKIYEKSKKCKLEDSFFSNLDMELIFLSSYFRKTKSQSLFIALVFNMNHKDTVDLNDLIRYLDCTPTKILEYSDDFKHLCISGIFQKRKSRFKVKTSWANDQYSINKKITEAIINNQPMPNIQNGKISNIFELLEELNNLGEQCYAGEISTQELFSKTREFIKQNIHFPLVRNINHFEFEIEDAYLFLFTIWKTIDGNKAIDIGRACETVFDYTATRFNYLQNFLLGENILIKDKYIEIVEPQYFNSSEMKLSSNSINLLKESGISLFNHNHQDNKKNKRDNILSPDQIPFKELIFCESEMQQIYLLKELLEDKNFRATQSRLTHKNLPEGVTILLHGLPGAGKTEIAKQLAKESNRELMKVEISQAKSKWYGESQKLVKQIFTDYILYAKECDRTPILLINEADALLSKRKSIQDSNTAQTENSLQNILLEEIENFSGILVATTNLVDNLDPAFERRFLIKVKFIKPGVSVRARIWKSKFPSLAIEDCEAIAERFNFSGGQIENILRKQEINEIIYDQQATLDNLLSFCKEETLTNQKVKIGFSNVAQRQE